LFESTLAADLSFLSALVFPRSSEQDYKAYLYLREAGRERQEHLPALWLYDVLYSPSSHAYSYGLARTRELATRLEALTGRVIRHDDFAAAIAEGNAARAAARQILALRAGTPRISGVEALALLGSLFLIDRARYATLAQRAAAEAAERPPLPGPRLAVAGAWVDDERLHAVLEAHGAVVVAEDGGWGARGSGRDVEPGADFVAAIFAKYHRDGPGVRQFPADDRAWLDELAGSTIDGVVFYLPPDDSVKGWDLPIARRRLDARGIPSLVIRDDIDDPEMPGRWHDRVAAFVADAVPRH
jgi:benzoyl-CoA reductase/2-hydroxyglutaryl-CoA dehydratase subunit BcrC/BadD/HgdB